MCVCAFEMRFSICVCVLDNDVFVCGCTSDKEDCFIFVVFTAVHNVI